jgi:hypothetical protein
LSEPGGVEVDRAGIFEASSGEDCVETALLSAEDNVAERSDDVASVSDVEEAVTKAWLAGRPIKSVFIDWPVNVIVNGWASELNMTVIIVVGVKVSDEMSSLELCDMVKSDCVNIAVAVMPELILEIALLSEAVSNEEDTPALEVIATSEVIKVVLEALSCNDTGLASEVVCSTPMTITSVSLLANVEV